MRKILAAVGFFVPALVPAQAAEKVELAVDTKSPAYDYVAALESENSERYAAIRTAAFDLNDDGIAEIAASYEGQGKCRPRPYCLMKIFHESAGTIFSLSAASELELLDADESGWRRIRVSDRGYPITWFYDASAGHYAVDLGAFDKTVTLEPMAPGKGRAAWLDKLLDEYGTRLDARSPVQVSYAEHDLDHDGSAEMFLMLESDLVCRPTGCPISIYRSIDEPPVWLNGGFATIGINSREGAPDDLVILRGLDVYEIFRFDAQALRYLSANKK